MAVVADDSGKEIKSVQDVLKSEGNDELKFGLLISLIKVSQVSNQDVVDTLLHLVSGKSNCLLFVWMCMQNMQSRVLPLEG